MSRSWTIGHDPSCDVVVPHDFVSTRHCRLNLTPTGFELEDLGSTNGTYVNGERLNGSRPVSQRDSITLGQTVPMPWPPAALAAAAAAPPSPPPPPARPGSRVITIGRTPENDVVLDYPMVSTRHARVVVDGKSITIEDLGSTNGTFLGSLQNRITRSTLSPSDTVYFGTQPIPAARLLGASAGPAATMAVTSEMLESAMAGGGRAATVPMTTTAAPPGVTARPKVPPLVLACAGAAGLMLIIALGIWASRPPKGSGKPNQSAGVEDGNGKGQTPDTPEGTSGKPADPSDVRSSMYLVLVDSRGDKRQRVLAGIGTATAVSDKRLITSGGVVTEVQRALAESWDVSIYSPSTKKEFKVVKAAVHPEYEAALGQFNTEKGKLDLAMEEMEALRTPPKEDEKPKEGSKESGEKKKPQQPAKPPPTPEEAKALVKRAMDAEDEMLKCNERLIHFDVGTLDVDGPMPTHATIAETKPDFRAALKLVGIPKDPKDPETIRSEIKEVLEDSGRYTTRSTMIPLTSVTEQDLLTRTNPDQRALWNWAGAAILNGEGQILGIYSRVTPPMKKDEVPDGRSTEIVLFSRWKDLIAR